MNHFKVKLGLLTVVLAAASVPAQAQVASVPPPADGKPGWSYAIAPYIWAPTISSEVKLTDPRTGGVVTSNMSVGFSDYLTDINFAAMASAVARNGKFTVMTDLVYMNASMTTNTSHLSSVNLGSGPIDIPRSLDLGTGTRMATTVWSLAGGYTVTSGIWGNLDLVGGLRMLSMQSKTNYTFSADILDKNGTVALSRGGSLSVNETYFEGVGGVTGRFNIPDSKFYIPFYFDAGGGALPFTWQAYTGLSYATGKWGDVGLGYRYLTFQNGGSTGVRNLSLSGVLLSGNFHF